METPESSQNLEQNTNRESNEKYSKNEVVTEQKNDPNAACAHDSKTVATSASVADVGDERCALIYDARQPEAIFHRVSRNQPIYVTYNVQNCNPEAGAQMSFGPTLIQEASSSDLQNEMDLLKHIRADLDALFVPTKAFTVSADMLRVHHALVVTGAPGSGKTFIGQQLLLKFCDDEKCNPFQPNMPEDYKNWLNTREKQVFLMDDVFGASNFNEIQYLAWISMFPKMVQHLRSTNTFLIFTCRDNILNFRLTALKAIDIFNNVINLSDVKFQMTEQNKEDIFDNHTRKFNIDIKYNELKNVRSLHTDPIGFPQRVRCLCSMTNVGNDTRIRYFNCPMEYLSTIIGSYRESDHVTYCVLILLMLNDGQLPVSYLKHSNKSSELVQFCFDICDITSSTMGALRSKADSLCGSLLLVSNDVYVYQHPSILEAVTLDFGQRYPSDILSRCSVHFLLERVFTRHSAPADNEYVAILQPVMFPQLCDRLVTEIAHYVNGQNAKLLTERHSFQSLSSYRVFKDAEFIKVFLSHLQDTGAFSLIFTSAIYDSPSLTSALSGQDALIQKVFASYLRDVQRISGIIDRLNQVLYAACNSGSPGAVRVLLAAGGQVDYMLVPSPVDVLYDHWRGPQTSTTLMHAAYSNNVEVLSLVCDRLKQQRVDMVEYIRIRDNSGRSILDWWWEGGRDEAALRFIVEAGADVNLKDNSGYTVLSSAAALGDEVICRQLLKAGADVNSRNLMDWTTTPMTPTRTIGWTTQHLQMMAGIDSIIQGKSGCTALRIAAEYGHEGICRLLLEAGADINMTANDGQTALHVSVRNGHGAVVRLLVQSGAGLHISALGIIPLEIAARRHMSDIANFIFDFMKKDLANTISHCTDNFLLNNLFTKENTWSSNKYVIIVPPVMFHLLCSRLVAYIEVCLDKENIMSIGECYHESPDVALQLLSCYAVFEDAVFIQAFILHLRRSDTLHLLSEIPTINMSAHHNTPDNLFSLYPLLSNDRYSHLSVIDVVTLDYGRRNPSDVLRRWSVHFVLERVFTQDSAPPDNEFIITIQPVMFLQLSSRIVKEITNCINDQNEKALMSLSSYAIFKDYSFTRVFLCHLQDTETFNLLFTSPSSDSRHSTFMFLAVTSDQDVLIKEVFFTYLHVVGQLCEFHQHLNPIFYAACYCGSVTAVATLLAAGAHANYKMTHIPDRVKKSGCTTSMYATNPNSSEALYLNGDRQQQMVDAMEFICIEDTMDSIPLHRWESSEQIADLLQWLIEKDTECTVLYCAAEHGDEAVSRLLLEAGADVNAANNDGRTALHVSAERGQYTIVRLLLEAGADVHIRASDRTPLEFSNDCDTADILCKCMVNDLANTLNLCSDNFLLYNVVIQDTDEFVCIDYIIVKPEMFPLLCARLVLFIQQHLKKDTFISTKECDVSLIERYMFKVFHDAAFTEVFLQHLLHIDAFHILSDIPPVITMPKRNTSESLCSSFPLLASDNYNHLSVLDVVTLDFGRRNPSDVLSHWSAQFLLEHVFTKESTEPHNVFIIILQPEMFSQLSSRLVDDITNCINDQNAEAMRSLSAYRVFEDDAFIELFLRHLQDTDAFHLLLLSVSTDSPNPTFLFLAAESGQCVLIQTVLSSYMCNIRRLPDFQGHLNRVLYAACSSGSVVAVRALLAAGAQADYRAAHPPGVVRHCWDEKTQICTTLMHAAYSSCVDVIRLICDRLEQQVDLKEYTSVRDNMGNTVLHWWAQGRQKEAALKFILNIFADVNLKNVTGQTVLHLANNLNNTTIYRELLAIEDDDIGIYCGVYQILQSNLHACVRVLVEAGADIHIRALGRIPLDVAISNNNDDTAEYLFGCMQNDLANTITRSSDKFLLSRVSTKETRLSESCYVFVLVPELFPLMCARLVAIIKRFFSRDNVLLSEECEDNSELHDESIDTLLRDFSGCKVLEDPVFINEFKQHLFAIEVLKPLLTSASVDNQHPEFIFRPRLLFRLLKDALALQKYNARCLHR